MANQIRVSLVEDEELTRQMLTQTVGRQPTLQVVHSVPSVQEARLLIAPRSTDVALIDVNLADGNGVALGLQLQRADPRLSVMLLSSEDVMPLFLSVQPQASRPWSYLSKRSTFARDVLIRAIEATARGGVVIDPYLTSRSTPRAGTGVAELSPAKVQVLRLVAQGLSNQAVGEELGLSPRSVESHLVTIYRLLGIDGEGQNRRVAAVLAFLEQTARITRA